MSAGPGRPAPGRSFGFVGRQRELGLLLAAVRHPPAVVLVEGEAGIGKSRLVHEAARALDADGRRVLTGHCHPLREPFPYGPVMDALRKGGRWLPAEGVPPTAGALAPLLPDLADRLPPPPPRARDAQGERYQLVHAVRAFLAAIGPAVLVVEDLHWVDEATRELLLLLARDLPDRLALIGTYRAEDLPPSTPVLGAAYRRPPGTSGAVIRLAPLSEAEIGELAAAALGGQATPALTAALHRRSEGLPLVAEEDLITLAEQSLPGRSAAAAADLAHAEVPRGLREAVTERLATLSATGAAMVDAAAVLAVPATEELLAAVAGLDPERGAAGLTEALQAAVLRETGWREDAQREPGAPEAGRPEAGVHGAGPGGEGPGGPVAGPPGAGGPGPGAPGHTGRYVFRHVLAQQVVYRHVPGPKRARLHRQAVEALRRLTPPPLVQIAHHTLAAGDREAWLPRVEEAAEQSIALGDTGTAATLLHQALEQPHLTAEARSRTALALGRIAVNGPDHLANAAVLRSILADPRLPTATRGEIRMDLGLLMVNHGGDRAGHLEIARAVGELDSMPEKAARAMTAMAMNERDEAAAASRGWLERAERTLEGSPDQAVRAAARATRLTLLARDGDPTVWAELERLPRRSSDTDVLRQTTRAVYNVGELAIELGHDRRAAELLAESRELARRADIAYLECYSRIALLRLEVLAGRWTGIEQRFAELGDQYPDMAMAGTEESLTLGRLAAARGRTAQALRLFRAAVEAGERESQVTSAVRAAAGLAAARLAEGAPADAWATAAPAVTVLARAGAWARATGLLPVAVAAGLACGEVREAGELVERAAEGLRGRDGPGADAELRLARGLWLAERQPERAAVEFEAARTLWQAVGRPYDTALADEQLARALAAGPDRERAAAHLSAATDTFARLGATADTARCRPLLRELGLARSGRGRQGYGSALSPRERQVAELLVEGATNQAIAQALFLSPRTIEQHVAHVLKKLDTTRRSIAEVYPGERA
ncbi:ATP-binding protein [Kitasatospora sp. NPDC096147]|uniref:ATP-binding protein n=1 Tax=Kitasatospora sp. NPDC096147 TaxID=3364093 RepID=UPI00381F40EC